MDTSGKGCIIVGGLRVVRDPVRKFAGLGYMWSPGYSMVAAYLLTLNYHDPCHKDVARIMVYTAGDAASQIRNTYTLEDHWTRRHPVAIDGPFPFPYDYEGWPTRAFIQGVITGMAIGHRKYLFQMQVGPAAYTAKISRVG